MSNPTAFERANDPFPEVIDGRYKLEELIGSGGMGSVFAGVDIRLERPIAVKVLREPGGASDERFRAEVRTLAGFRHPNLVRLLDAGELHGRPYFVMDLVDGPTLAQRLAAGPLEEAETRRIGRDIAAALAYVHESGVVHRDVKPANVLIDPSGTALLADFGIARLIDTTGMTATGMTMGTPAYLAPEQLLGGAVGGAADVYALGLVLLECLTGRRAFEGTPAEIAAARLSREPHLPETLSPGWREVLASMTAREPALRADAATLSTLLALDDSTAATREGPTVPLGAAALAGATVPLAARSDDVTRVAAPHDGELAARSHEPRGGWGRIHRRSRRVIVGGGLAVGAIGLGLGIGYAVGGPTPAAANQPHLVVTTKSSATTVPSTSTSSSNTSSTTSTSTSTTTSTTAPPTVSSVAGSLQSVLQAGAANGTIDQPAAQRLEQQLAPLLLASAGSASRQQLQQFDQLALTFQQQLAAGAIRGASATRVAASLNQLAATLQTSVPTSTTATAPTTPPTTPPAGPPPGHGDGNGHGHGHGGHGGHGG